MIYLDLSQERHVLFFHTESDVKNVLARVGTARYLQAFLSDATNN